MPETSEKILAQINATKGELETLKAGEYPNDTKVVEKPEILFARIDEEEFMKKIHEKEAAQAAEAEKAEAPEDVIDIEAKPEITFDDFMKMQFQVGEIISCEAVKKSRKLFVLPGSYRKRGKTDRVRYQGSLQFRRNGRQKVMVLVNLKPAKLAGVLSEGMLLCAEDADGNLALMTPEKPMPAGAEIC